MCGGDNDNGLRTKIPVGVFRSVRGGRLLSNSRERRRRGEDLPRIVLLEGKQRL